MGASVATVKISLLAIAIVSCGKGTRFSSAGGKATPPVPAAASCTQDFSISSPPKDKLLLAKPASPDSIELDLEVRDFRAEHPDFEEEAYIGEQRHQLAPTLDSEGLPVFIGQERKTITSAQTFNQWFRDSAVSQKISKTITLKRDPQRGIYQYLNDAFFPLDDEGFGNEGNAHNYHFTAMTRAAFTYNGGEVFSFTGDDDIWVFIDNRLVVDLGGVHSSLSETVAIDSLGLEKGKEYPLVLFFAERKLVESHFRIETSLALQKPSSPYSYKVGVTTNAPRDLRYRLLEAPKGMQINESSGEVLWTATAADVGSHRVVIEASAAHSCSARQEFMLTVEHP